MDYQRIKESVERGDVDPLYLIYGEEEYLQEQLIKAIKKVIVPDESGAFNLAELDGEKVSCGEIVELANTVPIFSKNRLVIVKNPFCLKGLKKEDEGNKAGEQMLLDYLADPMSGTCLVLWQQGQVDKRKKLYKQFIKTGIVLEISPLKGTGLINWLKEEARCMGKALEPRALEYMTVFAGSNLRHLKNELEKAVLYSDSQKMITLDMVKEIVTKTSEANIFNMVDSIGMRQVEGALKELRTLLELNEPPGRILFMIARQFRLLIQTKDLTEKGYSEKDITAKIGIHPFVTVKLIKQVKNFSFAELEEGMSAILQTDLDLKSGTNAKSALENLLFNLSNLA